MPTDAILDTPPTETVSQQDKVGEVAGYLNISKSKKDQLESGLPLSLQERPDMFNNGAFRIINYGKVPRGEIVLRLGAGPETWLEEITHYIQTAGNPELQQSLIEINQLYEKSENDILLSIDESLVVADRAKEIAIEETDRMALRLNLKPTHAPQDSQEIATAIRTKVGSRDTNSYFTGGTVSGGQAIQILSAIDRSVGKQSGETILDADIDHFLLASKALAKISQEVPSDRNSEELRILRDRKAESQDHIRSSMASKVTTLLENPNNVPVIEQAFNQSHVPIDGVTFRSNQLTKQIMELDDEQAKQCLINYLSQDCDPNELLYVSQLIVGRWSQNFEELGELDRGQNLDRTQRLKEIQSTLVNDISALEVGKMAEDPRKIIVNLVRQTQSIASARAGTETSLIYLLDDFPADEEAKNVLLGNPEYVRAYIKATLDALKSGEFTPLNVKIDPGQFSRSEEIGNQIAKETLERAFSEPEAVIFFQELVKKMEYERYRSSNADTLLMYGNWQVDMQLIADGLDLRQPIDDNRFATELGMAKLESLKSIKRKQDMDTKRHLRDVLVEPIAKILVAQRLGRGKDSVVFSQNMMGGYSELLRSQDSERWIDSLWNFVEMVHNDKSGGERAIFDFIKCNSIAEQVAVVNKYLKQNN